MGHVPLWMQVIVSSTSLHDAKFRWRGEQDSNTSMSRLRLVGDVFRRAKNAFSFVTSIKQILKDWKDDTCVDTGGQPDILINNAAQTLTDPISVERQTIKLENTLQPLTNGAALEIDKGYEATVRGWSHTLGGLLKPQDTAPFHPRNSYNSQKTEDPPLTTAVSTHRHLDEKAPSLKPDITGDTIRRPISSHSINKFVTIILIRELLPLMQRSTRVSPAHIINVSSHEGIFESPPTVPRKAATMFIPTYRKRLKHNHRD